MLEPLVHLFEAILPLPLPGTFTYRIPAELVGSVVPGVRVVVQFGKQKVYTALVKELHQRVPQHYEVDRKSVV